MGQILIYVDQGVSGMTLLHTVKSLQREVDSAAFSIKRVDATFLAKEPWEKEADLLIIPGGRDVYYQMLLSTEAVEKIRSFVERGGKYLGLCAGAYFASSEIEFEKGGHLEVCAKRSLGFFPGLAKGPVYGRGKYSCESEKGVAAAPLIWQTQECFAYFNGGCSFEEPEKYSSVEVLSRYAHLDAAAIVSCSVGRGRALLSGAHVEVSSEHLFAHKAPEIEKIYPLLQQKEAVRRALFRHILESLSIQLTSM